MLLKAIDHVAHLLPSQGPIGVFIHHNTLHAFEDLPFEEAVEKAAKVFNANPYFSEEQYRSEILKGRVLEEDVQFELNRFLAQKSQTRLPIRGTLYELYQNIILQGIDDDHGAPLNWRIQENLIPGDFSLFSLCKKLADNVAGDLPLTSKEVFLPEIPCAQVKLYPWIIQMCGAFMDCGIARWNLPDRNQGLWKSVSSLWMQPGIIGDSWLNVLRTKLYELKDSDCESIILSELKKRGITEDQWEFYLEKSLMPLRGWAGLIYKMQTEPELFSSEAENASLTEFIALKLVAESALLEDEGVPMSSSQFIVRSHTAFDPGYVLFQLSKYMNWSLSEIQSLSDSELKYLLNLVLDFNSFTRRRILHLAYERSHRNEALTALSMHLQVEQPNPCTTKAQVVFCIDEREEAIRRHLETIAPDIETFGTAGFFGIAIRYRGLDEANAAALCPVVAKPSHKVHERPTQEDRIDAFIRRNRRAIRARFKDSVSVSSKSLGAGWAITVAIGSIFIIPLIAAISTPIAYAKGYGLLKKFRLPKVRTRLLVQRESKEPSDPLDALTLQESADRVERVLKDIGLVNNFSETIVLLGHGSSSQNNPHESAHDCGACGGRRGGPNARLYANLANSTKVREELKIRGIHIPSTTVFIGGYHDTSSEEVTLFDTENLSDKFSYVSDMLDQARKLSAQERIRRFEFATLNASPEDALRDVEIRANALFETRPEYGHCTNAMCIVGRRELSRGLFLDRRSFLVSYNPEIDKNLDILTRILTAVGPVGAGINLEYYFSVVDNEVYGCGTKLPHNISGLVGVMNGASSDLRTGLPWQMVELHEPVRLLTVVEAYPDSILEVAKRSPVVGGLVVNRWIQLVSCDPVTRAFQVFDNGKFIPFEEKFMQLPKVSSWKQWYSGKKEHLGPAILSSERLSG